MTEVAKRSPSVEYSDEIADAICTLASEGKSLKEICALDGMPSRMSVYRWLADNQTFSDMYARAREERAELFADEIIGIADTEKDPNIARVRIDARKWAAAKLNPKQYGERVDMNHSGRVTMTHEQAIEQLK